MSAMPVHSFPQLVATKGSPTASIAPKAPLKIRMVIIQADNAGLDGWTLAEHCKAHRWDTLLDCALKCLMLDGQWQQNVTVHIFVGGDVITLTSDIQSTIMTDIRDDKACFTGHFRREPATVGHFQACLYGLLKPPKWQTRPEVPGLSLERNVGAGSAQQRLLENLKNFVSKAEPDSMAMVMNYGADTKGYATLKAKGCDLDPGSPEVFVLLGGAHGFDGADDKKQGLYEDICREFATSLKGRLVKVNLCEDTKPNSNPVKLTAVQVASFIATQHICGGLRKVIAGAEVGLSGKQPTPAPWRPPSPESLQKQYEETREELEELRRQNEELQALQASKDEIIKRMQLELETLKASKDDIIEGMQLELEMLKNDLSEKIIDCNEEAAPGGLADGLLCVTKKAQDEDGFSADTASSPASSSPASSRPGSAGRSVASARSGSASGRVVSARADVAETKGAPTIPARKRWAEMAEEDEDDDFGVSAVEEEEEVVIMPASYAALLGSGPEPAIAFGSFGA